MWKLFKRFWRKSLFLWIIYIIFLAFLFFTNTLHDSYPDEFDNILGGKYILEGRLPHSGFFTHHGPVAYWVAAIVEVFSGISFVRFRIVYCIFLLIFVLFSYFFLKKRFFDKVNFYLFLMVVFGISATYFWGHMLLADSLTGFLLVPVYLLLLLSGVHGRKLTINDLLTIGILTFLSLLSSLTYLYLIFIIYVYTLYLYFRKAKHKLDFKSVLKPLLTLAIPYLFFLGYLFITKGLSAYVQQNIIFNSKYYIYNYPHPEGSSRINPVRFAIIIANEFINAFSGLLVNAKDLNFNYPFNSALALANVAVLVWLLFFGQFNLAIFVFLILIFTNARSNPLTSKETDYQSAVYIMISMTNFILIIPYFYNLLNKNLVLGKKIVFGFLFIILCIYGVFTMLFLFRKFEEKAFNKYMGKAPLIYDRPQLAPIMNKLVSNNDYMWIGPFEFEELFYARGKVPSRFHILIPGMGKAPEIQQAFLVDFQKNKPKVIIFDRRFFILGKSPEMYAQFFLDFLQANYITLYDYRANDGSMYISVNPVNERVDIETKLYISKDNINEVIDKMLKENLIRPQIASPTAANNNIK